MAKSKREGPVVPVIEQISTADLIPYARNSRTHSDEQVAQIADSIEQHLLARGVAVVVRGQHACMSCRGVRKAEATMVTSAMRGELKSSSIARSEFLELIK